jgi:hypothetical protein
VYKKSARKETKYKKSAIKEAGIHAEAIDHDAALKIDCRASMRRFEHIGAQLHAIINVQKQRQASKRIRDSEMSAPAPKRPAPFTPPRKAPISVQPT